MNSRPRPEAGSRNLGQTRTLGVLENEKRIRTVILTRRQCDPVSLRVEEAADLRELAVPLDGVLDGRRLHEKRVLAVILGYIGGSKDVQNIYTEGLDVI